MRPLAPLKFVMVTEGRIASASILDRVFAGLHGRGCWDYQSCYEWDCSFAEIGEAIRAADVALFLRCTRPEEAALFEQARRQGLPTVYCVDDDFDTLDPATTHGHFYGQPEMRESRDRMMREADLVWVFTAELAARVRDRCRRLHVGRLPSFVEDHGWELSAIDQADADGPLTIGYGGRYVHAPDLEVIVAPLRELLDSCDRPLRAEFIDCLPPGLENHPQVTRLPYFDDMKHYYDHLRAARWAIGLAPLIDSLGNRAKTNNKYREYAALGIPGIYSDMPVYSSSVRHRETGYLAPHTEPGMYEALRTLVADAELRRRIRRRALEDAATTYALLPMQQEWLREVSLLATGAGPPVKLLVVAHHEVTTTHIDALPAARALRQQGRLQFEYVQPLEARAADVARCDAVFLVRAFAPETVRLLEWAEAARAALVCAWDDDFHSLPPTTALGTYHAQVSVRAAVARFLRECSLIATTTPPLSERSRRYNPHVMEAIYGFDTADLPLEPLAEDGPADEPLRIGFFGLQWAIAPPCVREAVRRVKERFGPRVAFEIISSREVPEDSTSLFEWRSTSEMSWAESLRLLRSRRWDIGLAPLEDTEFNAAKQATKFRDYAWAGLAMICSRLPAYQRPMIDGLHGLLVPNTTAAWEAAMVRIIEDRPLRLSLRRAARDLFAQAHTLEATMCAWYQLVWRLARHRHGAEPPSESWRARALSLAPSARTSLPPAEQGLSASPRLMGARLYELVPEADGWESLEVLLGLHQRPAGGQLVLSIHAEGVGAPPLRRIARDLRQAVDNGWFRFSFRPIANSRARRLRLRFELENPGPGTRLSLYERGQRSTALLARVLARLSRRGGALFCQLGYRA